MKLRCLSIGALTVLMLPAVSLEAQRGAAPAVPAGPAAAGAQRGAQRGAARTPKESAPIDLTGYWVSVVSEDWRVRMTMGQKGDWEFMPLSAEGRRVAESANPAKEDPCKAYGAAGIMRQPGRLNVTWANDTTMRIEADAGMQTRELHFTQAPAGEATMQGYAAAQWQARVPNADVGGKTAPGGELRVVTTKMQPGYYFKHGVPYSADAVMTEYFARVSEPAGDYLLVTTMVDDPQYLSQPYVKTLTFKKEPNGSKFKPTACSVP